MRARAHARTRAHRSRKSTKRFTTAFPHASRCGSSPNHNHQVDYFVAMVLAGYVCVVIIHRTLTWTTGSLTCAQMSMHAIAHGGVRAPKKSVLTVNSGKKIPCRTRESKLRRRRAGPMFYQLSYISSPGWVLSVHCLTVGLHHFYLTCNHSFKRHLRLLWRVKNTKFRCVGLQHWHCVSSILSLGEQNQRQSIFALISWV